MLDATVTDTVKASTTRQNRPPIASNGVVETEAETEVTGTLTGSDPDEDILTFTLTSIGEKGRAILTDAKSGAFTYTPDAGMTGDDIFTFTISDGLATSQSAEIRITIKPKNVAPVAQNGSVTTNEDMAVNRLFAATDADGNVLTYHLEDVPAHGEVELNQVDGYFNYRPNKDYFGTDSFTFCANDGQVDSNTATVTITVNPVNDPPVASSQSVQTVKNIAVAIILVATDVANEQGNLAYTVIKRPTHGTLSGAAPNLTYKPAAGYFGTDSFTFKANDGKANSNIATISITIKPIADQPLRGVSLCRKPCNYILFTKKPITLKATPIGGTNVKYLFEYSADCGKNWSNISNSFDASNTCTWRPMKAGLYLFRVRACNNGNIELGIKTSNYLLCIILC
ncbi:MAG: Ig-like domain-containing protein [Armatimonadota bacterium]